MALQGAVHEDQRGLQGHAHGVGEFERRRPGPALRTIHGDEVGTIPQLGHDAAELGELLGAADAKLDAHRLSAAQFAQLPDEVDHSTRIGERGMTGWGEHRGVRFHMPEARDLLGVLGRRKHAPMPGLGALRQLQLDHLDRLVRGLLPEQVGIEMAILVAAAEVARTDLPDHVAAVVQVVVAEPAFTGVVVEAALLRSGVQCQHGIGAQGAEAHGRDVEQTGLIGPGAMRAADAHPRRMFLHGRRIQRVADALVLHGIDVQLRAEGHRVAHVLGPRVGQGALLAAEGASVRMPLDEVLLDLRRDELEEVAGIAQHREVAQDGVAVLQGVEHTDQEQREHHRVGPPHARDPPANDANGHDQADARGVEEVAHPGQT